MIGRDKPMTWFLRINYWICQLMIFASPFAAYNKGFGAGFMFLVVGLLWGFMTCTNDDDCWGTKK